LSIRMGRTGAPIFEILRDADQFHRFRLINASRLFGAADRGRCRCGDAIEHVG
jgi:hypothetical protein